MYHKGSRFIIAIVGFIYLCSVGSGVSRIADRGAELVVVLNQDITNPLGGDIWLMDSSGRLVRDITKNSHHEEHPNFSPDGNKIVFVRNLGEWVPGVGIDPRQNEIFVVDLRTGQEKRLTHNQVEDSHPEWSYDGKYILFYSRRNHPRHKATLWIMESDGAHPRQVTTLEPGDVSHLDPVWSPNGYWVAFANQREEGDALYSRIEKIRSDGTQRTVVSSGGEFPTPGRPDARMPPGDRDPHFSPEGAMIFSARRLGDGQVRLFSYGANAYYGGKAETKMVWDAEADGAARHPRFSPDGRRIVFTRSSPKGGHPTRQIVLTDPRSSFRRYITSRSDWDLWHPSWHPFALSGAERETAGTLVSYGAPGLLAPRDTSGKKDATALAAEDLPASDRFQTVLSPIKVEDPKHGAKAVHELTWRIDMPPERVISLTLRLQGELQGDRREGRSLDLQLMDWKEKKWVTVFDRYEISKDQVRILHEIAPAHFIHRDTRAIRLRIITPVALPPTADNLKMSQLRLDVKRD